MHHRDEDLPARSDAVGLVLELVRPQLEERLEQQDHHHLFFLFTKCRLCVFFRAVDSEPDPQSFSLLDSDPGRKRFENETEKCKEISSNCNSILKN